MKKITLFTFLIASFTSFSQQKSTGVVSLSSNMTVKLTLNNTTSKANLILTGPSDRWFAIQFGSFADGDGMASGEDMVYADGTTLIDAKMGGVGVTPSTDATQNWTVTSNTVNPDSGIRTIVAERNFSTGDANDYTFNYGGATIDFVWARRSSAGYSLNNHGTSNRGYAIDTPITTALDTPDFSLNTASVFPNPSNGTFNISTKLGLNKIAIYSQTGSFVKSIDVTSEATNFNCDLSDLQKGIYFMELQNDTDKSWKKIIIE